MWIRILIAVIFALLPSAFWLCFFLRYDWRKPEPPKIIFLVFMYSLFGGALVLMLRYFDITSFSDDIFSQAWLNVAFYAFCCVALLEEFVKVAAVLIGAYFNKFFDEYIDGIIYGITAGLGLAAFENGLGIYAIGAQAVLFRFATSTLLHAMLGGFMGYFLSLAKFGRNKKLSIALGMLVVIALHAFYNVLSIMNGLTAKVSLVGLLILLFVWLIVLIKKAQHKKLIDLSMLNHG